VTVLRRLDGRWEGVPGWTVDQLGDVVQVRRFGREAPADEEVSEVVAAILDFHDSACVVLRAAGSTRVVHGTLPDASPDDPVVRAGRFVVEEAGIRFGVDVLHGSNLGLFADARPMRAWLRARVDERRVLNLFSYTSAFGVHAAAGGARSVTNVDVVPSALERGAANFALNHLPTDSRTHVRSDALELLKRAAKRGETWDAVVVDPPPVPTVGRGRKGKARGRFDPRRDWPRLAVAAHRVCAPGGVLLLLSAARGGDGFENLVTQALPGTSWTELSRGTDFPGGRTDGLRGLAATVA
jgi:23S rRNA (cytosine1962-C5)-methyltransferase